MAIRINNPLNASIICIGDIKEDGTTWVDEYGNLGILVDDEPYLFQSNQLQKYEHNYSNYLPFTVNLVDIEITVKQKEY